MYVERMKVKDERRLYIQQREAEEDSAEIARRG